MRERTSKGVRELERLAACTAVHACARNRQHQARESREKSRPERCGSCLKVGRRIWIAASHIPLASAPSCRRSCCVQGLLGAKQLRVVANGQRAGCRCIGTWESLAGLRLPRHRTCGRACGGSAAWSGFEHRVRSSPGGAGRASGSSCARASAVRRPWARPPPEW